jgi:hypothetical protein
MFELDSIPPKSLGLTRSVVQGSRSPRAETGMRKQIDPSLLIKKIKGLKWMTVRGVLRFIQWFASLSKIWQVRSRLYI